MSNAKFFTDVLNTFEHADLRYVCEECIEMIPEYFFKIAASTTGKYHPSYALGEGGLLRHTLAVVKFLNYHFELDCFKEDFNSRERDLMRIAAIMHDAYKTGIEESRYTCFDHPLISAEQIRKSNICLSNEDKELIANAIESHMGQWNTDKRSDITLPTPKNKYQKLLHLCDYLASRKDLEVKFENVPSETDNISTYLFPFGKHKGVPITQVPEDYLRWLQEKSIKENNPLKEPLAGYVKRILG